MQAHNTIASEDPATSSAKPELERAGNGSDGAARAETSSHQPQSGIGVEFLSNLAHQLRSPLSSLRVWVDLLSDPAAIANPEDTKRLVEGIDRATSRLERQISDVLEVGYLEAGTLTFESVPVDATEQILGAVADADHAARSRRIGFDLDLGGDQSTVLSSEVRLRQILAALLSNAIRFSPVDGTISITAGSKPRIANTPDATEVLAPESIGNAYYVCVSNSGPAIPAELHHEIFRPFQRAVRRDSHGGGGSGLGLAIVFGLIKLHGGGIWLRSNIDDGQDSGAKFEYALPAPPSANTASPAAIAPARTVGSELN